MLAPMSDFEVIAAGLQFPEGPIVMPDGSVILVEIKRKTLTRVWKGRQEVIANVGGGPNGAAIGPDGAVYITNNGGFEYHDMGGLTIPGHAAHDYVTGRIERVDLNTGKVERLYDKVGDNKLSGPNDLVFDKAGNIWFSDLGKGYPRSSDRGGIYFCKTDGSLIKEAAYGCTGINGIGLSPDEKTVYGAETETGKLWAFDITGEGEVAPGPLGAIGRCVAVQPYHCYFDSLAVQANGDVCVATILNGGITTITPAGVSTHTAFPDPLVTNIAFGGADMRDAYITLSGTGQLIKARWPEPGLKLNFAPY
jgi:gluconolactonase